MKHLSKGQKKRRKRRHLNRSAEKMEHMLLQPTLRLWPGLSTNDNGFSFDELVVLYPVRTLSDFYTHTYPLRGKVTT